jgi:DNA helicase-2/ATP-dependent DNA helicase PcrA
MSVLGVGLDLVDVDRFNRVYGGSEEDALRRCFSQTELENAGSGIDRMQHLAGRFAAKEAVLNPRGDYPAIRDAAAMLLGSGHLNDVVRSTYSRLIVDEYQDCNAAQHQIVKHLAQILPTVVLGDPLQAIFGFGRNPVVDWDKEVLTSFPAAGELATPHRWINAGEEGFGRWLLDIRKDLIDGRSIDLSKMHGKAVWVQLDGSAADRQRRWKAGMSAAPTKDGKVLIIADSMNKAGQYDYAKQLAGAVVAEAVDLGDLVSFATGFDVAAADAIDRIVRFAGDIMTNVGSEDFLKRLATLKAGRAKNPANDAEMTALSFIGNPTYQGASQVMNSIAAMGGVKVHRPTMLSAFYSTLRECSSTPGSTPLEAAVTARERGRLIGRPLSKRTVGSTLLLKGLEADVSVILDVDRMDASHLYVAMTRGSKQLIVCSQPAALPL